jgi:hypothetical protein
MDNDGGTLMIMIWRIDTLRYKYSGDTGSLGSVFLRIICNMVFLLPGISGCSSVGPNSIPRDRLDYSQSIDDSWKRQTLLNIVRLRYMDSPFFLDVSQVVAGYSCEVSAGASTNIYTQGRAFNSVGVSGSGSFSDHPTITYMPLTGDKFLRGLMDAVPPHCILYLMQTGFPADYILALGVDSLNGLHNRAYYAGEVRKADPDFVRITELLRDIQAAGAVALRIEEGEARHQSATLFFRHENVPSEIQKKIEEFRQLLHLPNDQFSFKLVYSPLRAGPGELAVESRSLLRMLSALSTFVDIPEIEVQQHRALTVPDTSAWTEPLFHVNCGQSLPQDAFIAVQYRNHWFWIDDTDWRSKRTLSTIMLLFTLADTGTGNQLPVLTIPAGGR